MKDYLNSNEMNDYMTIRFTVVILERILKEWGKRNNLAKEEITALKYSITYMSRFFQKIENRLSQRFSEQMAKRLSKFEFKLIDEFQMKKIFRETNDAMKNAVIPREDFDNLCEEFMNLHCKDCHKDWKTCKIYTAFDNNFAVEPTGYELDNCKYAYDGSINFEKEKCGA